MSLNSDDIIEIQQHYARYNTAIDTGDGKGFAACFVPQGVFDSGMGDVIEGREGIAGFADQTHSAMPGMRHNVTNIVIEGDGSHAQGSAFLIGYLTDGGYKVIVTGRYTDELTKTDDGWRFTKRIFKADS
ncbi:MAG: nuclear transport factor 2 family protein [Myxococcota bacterium]